MIEGVVVNIIDSKTAKVNVSSISSHPVYKKIIKKIDSFLCHTDGFVLQKGDRVFIAHSRPYSKNKAYIVVKKG